MPEQYIFQSDNLGFRNWQISDIELLYEINSDPDVMKYFPRCYTREEVVSFIIRMQKQYRKKGYTYFAIDHLKDDTLIGFIGLAFQNFESPFTPCIDIGWRLNKHYWNRGLATEGARSCLDYGFKELKLSSVRSITPEINKASIHIMNKIGMAPIGVFEHPLLTDNPTLSHCVVYEINREQHI